MSEPDEVVSVERVGHVTKGCRRFSAALMAAMFVSVLSGCSNSNTPLSPEAKAMIEKEAPPSTGAQIGGPMPASLNEAYQNAEKVFAAVSSMDWASGETLNAALKRSLAQLRTDLNPVTTANDSQAGVVTNKADMIDSDQSSLVNAIRAHDLESAKRLSNAITMRIAELAGMYASPVPGELMMLKYYSRQWDIAASTNDMPFLQETADNVRRTWIGLRPAVEAQGGITEADRFNDLVDDLEESGPAGQIGDILQDRIVEIQEVLKQ